MGSLSLSDGEHTRQEWEQLAAAVLRRSGRLGEDAPDDEVWEALTRRTLDGIAVPPLGTPALREGLRTSGRPARAGEWDVRVLAADPDPARCAQATRTDLENGATSVWLRVGEHGVPADALGSVLDAVLVDVAPVVLDATEEPLGVAEQFAAIVKGAPLAAGTNLGIDPVGAALRRGAAVAEHAEAARPESVVADAAGIARQIGARALVIDATVVHDLGASDVQELGYAIAVAATYLRALEAAGHDPAAASGLIDFRLAATDEQFPTIAKLRAARRLWRRMLDLSGVPAGSTTGSEAMRLHAVTSRPMLSRYGPWVNMLRTCVAAFAAGTGGADAVTVLPFDTPLGMPDEFGRRIARNTSALLISESHVARVTDPAGGSHLVEKLTDDLAAAAWDELGRIEEAGGIEAALDDGSLLGRIERVAAERDDQVARRQRPLTGLSEFPNLHESLPERAPYADGTPTVRSYGHAFEALRDEPMGRPVFLATMGTIAAHTARASFATNLFAAGGIDVVNTGAHEGVDAVLADYSGEPVVCVCGSDAAYAEWGTELVAALREAGARWTVVAGRAIEGADDSCARGEDAIDFLTRTRERLA